MCGPSGEDRSSRCSGMANRTTAGRSGCLDRAQMRVPARIGSGARSPSRIGFGQNRSGQDREYLSHVFFSGANPVHHNGSRTFRAGTGDRERKHGRARNGDRPGSAHGSRDTRLWPAAGHPGSRGVVHRIVQRDRGPAAGAALGQGAEALCREGARDDLPGRAHCRAAQHLVRKVGHRLPRARRQRHARRHGDVSAKQGQARRRHRH